MLKDRTEAGEKLSNILKKYKGENTIVLAIPRGGVIVGDSIAKALGLKLEIIGVRKLGYPPEPEYGIGAISENGAIYLDKIAIKLLKIDKTQLGKIEGTQRRELRRRILLYRKGKNLPRLKNKTVILVDDGMATGVTVRAAILAIKKEKPSRIILALPISSLETKKEIEREVDKVISLNAEENLRSIGQFYENFEQVSDREILKILKNNQS